MRTMIDMIDTLIKHLRHYKLLKSNLKLHLYYKLCILTILQIEYN